MTATLPPTKQVIEFEHIGPCYWLYVGFRPPHYGDYFLSDAKVQAYHYAGPGTHNVSPYHIVHPTYHAERGWNRGARVDIPQMRPYRYTWQAPWKRERPEEDKS